MQTGEIRVRGLELEATTTLTRQLDLVASYTYLDPVITHTNNPDELGRQPTQTARNTAKVWADYKFQNEVLRGWSLGGGVRYIDKVVAMNTAEGVVFNPSYALFDAAIRYKTGPVTLALNAANVFDKAYVANRGQFYGQGRVLQATMACRW